MQTKALTRRYLITGSQKASNFLWASGISLGGAGFLLTGFAAFIQKPEQSLGSYVDLFIFNQSRNIAFFPQGLIMCFYGSLGLLFGIYLWCTIFWQLGNGFNEFNTKEGFVRIFRWGLPGKERRLDIRYNIKDIEEVRVDFKEGINARRTIYIKIKGKGDIPLIRIAQPIAFEQVEIEALELSQDLQVSLQTSYENV
jgi:hypothetical protein